MFIFCRCGKLALFCILIVARGSWFVKREAYLVFRMSQCMVNWLLAIHKSLVCFHLRLNLSGILRQAQDRLLSFDPSISLGQAVFFLRSSACLALRGGLSVYYLSTGRYYNILLANFQSKSQQSGIFPAWSIAFANATLIHKILSCRNCSTG
jgi:hypothetical protein